MALSVAEVRSALDEGDESVRLGAIARLDLLERGALPLIARAMADRDWRVRREAVERVLDGTLPRESLAQCSCCRCSPIQTTYPYATLRWRSPWPSAWWRCPRCTRSSRRGPRIARSCATCSAAWAPASRPCRWPRCSVTKTRTCASPRPKRSGASIARALPLPEQTTVALARTLLDSLDGLLRAPDLDRWAFFGSALLDALARRGVPLSAERLEVLTRAKVLGVGALRAIAMGAVSANLEERNAARAVATRYLGDTVRARREAALLAVARLASPSDLVVLDAAARAGAIEAVLEGTLEVQRAAACVLGVSGDPVAARALLVALEDPAIAGAATEGLYLLARRDAGALVATAETLGDAARTAVYRAIARSGAEVNDPNASAALLRALKRDLAADDDALATAAGEVLGALRRGRRSGRARRFAR